jgi:GNAT superfamily N-acetyltransferase
MARGSTFRCSPKGRHEPLRETPVIRPADERDIPTILTLIRQLAEYERAAHEVVATESQLRESLFGDDAVASCLLAIEPATSSDPAPDTERVVGLALWFRSFSTWLGTPGIYLEDLFVLPDARRGGHGRRLLAALAEIAVQRGYQRVEWSVLNWNEPAMAFYRRLGAAPQEEWTVWRVTGDALRGLGGKPQDTQDTQ